MEKKRGSKNVFFFFFFVFFLLSLSFIILSLLIKVPIKGSLGSWAFLVIKPYFL